LECVVYFVIGNVFTLCRITKTAFHQHLSTESIEMKRQFIKYFFAASALAVLAACGGSDDPAPAPAPAAPTKNIVELAQATPNLSILVEAVGKADLATALSGAGPFTVFAPTDTAFAALLDELKITKEALLNDKTLLTAVLKYHVVPAKVLKADIPFGKPITSLQGETFTIDTTATITDARARTSSIKTTDILATNGVVHVIDKVILPKP
jgi:uncharacterized surface protein with fasciclin (FAS1) repeats